MIDDQVQLLYREGPCLVVNKPAGILTQAPPAIDSLELRVKRWLADQEGKTGNVYLGVPHRLDRPVTGAIVLARHVRATRRLAEQFEGRLVRKVYWACVEGQVEPLEGEWQDWMIKVPGEPRGAVVEPGDPQARLARLRYRTLGHSICESQQQSWLEIELETGRTHQIRVQASARGWPVVGDAFYGAQRRFGPPESDERLRPIALHAQCLAFRHPMTQERVEISAPLPPSWNELALTPLS